MQGTDEPVVNVISFADIWSQTKVLENKDFEQILVLKENSEEVITIHSEGEHE